MTAPFAAIERFSRQCDRLAALVLLPVLTLFILTDVFCRYVLNAPIIWNLEISSLGLSLVFLLALPECTRKNGHITMDMVYIHMPLLPRRVVMGMYSAAGIFIFTVLAYKQIDELLFIYDFGKYTEYLRVPIWPFYLAYILISLLLILLFVLRGISVVRGDRDAVAHSSDTND